ncbi:MAG: hypothetical protein M3Y08_02915 [Fibrobacterota bacterium]|nr:hypothetical protein [Fibrobacterota bacterium]
MNLISAAILFIIWAGGAALSILYSISTGATLVLGLVLWNSFFGFSTAVGLMLFWSREHWMG